MIARNLSFNATRVISSAYAKSARPADPHKLLTDIARSTSIVGELLDHLTTEYAKVKNRPAKWVSLAGRFMWGLVELSVPNTVGPYFIRNWVKLSYLVSLAILLLGFVVGEPPMWGIGAAMIVGTYLVSTISKTFHRFVATAKFPWGILMRAATYTGAALLLAGIAFAAHMWGDWIAGGLSWLAGRFNWAHGVHLRDLARLLPHV